MGKYKVIWVADEKNRRDYRDRQLYANAQGAHCYLEAHYNAKVYDKPGVADNPSTCLVTDNSGAKTRFMAVYFSKRVSESLGHPNGGCVVLKKGDRAYYNTYYAKGNALLLEPLYVSDVEQAMLAQSEYGQDKIAEIIRDMICEYYPTGATIALSLGHKFKVSSPFDRGAPVAGAPTLGEADLAEIYLKKAAALLEAIPADEAPSETVRDIAFDLTPALRDVPLSIVSVRLSGAWDVVRHTPTFIELKQKSTT